MLGMKYDLDATGLNKKQQAVYLVLLQRGSLSASELAHELGEQRTNIYQIADQLEALGLVVKDESKPVATFVAANPRALQELLLKQQQQLALQAKQLKKQLPELAGLFQLNIATTGMAYFEGLDGYTAALQDMVNSNLEVCVFAASEITAKRPDAKQVLDKLLQKRAQSKVPTKLIFEAALKNASGLPGGTDKAASRYIQLRFWGNEPFGSGEIALYGSTAVLTSYDDKLVSVVIKNPQITGILQGIFNTAWQAATEV